MNFIGETPAFIVTAVVLVSYELIKGLVAKGLQTSATVEEALWKKGVTDSLANLIVLNSQIKKDLEDHIMDDRANSLSRRL